MQTEWLLPALFAGIAFLALCGCFYTVLHVKRQIKKMTEMLEDVKQGNGNRRLLTETNELTAPLVYEINEMIMTYEGRLSAYRQAEEQNRKLMTNISHDVRTPLTTLIGYLDAAQKRKIRGIGYEEEIETARRKAHDLKLYIDELFDWFKLHSNEYTSKIELLEMGELTRSILIDWVPILEDHQIDYVVDIPETPIWVKADREGYRRVMNNLIQNVVVHSRASKMKVTMSVQRQNMKLELSDDGVGIAKEELEHIFERLYQGEQARPGMGSGLGLSIVQPIIAYMNGSITVQSIPKIETAFTILFPLAQ